MAEQASAVAMANPREHRFVVDLSGSMNDDTDPNDTASINRSYPGVGTTMMQNFLQRLRVRHVPGNVASHRISVLSAVSSITSLSSTISSPLLYSKISSMNKGTRSNHELHGSHAKYLIYVSNDGSGKTADTSTTATKKAYSWVIDEQLGGKSGQAAVPGCYGSRQTRSR